MAVGNEIKNPNELAVPSLTTTKAIEAFNKILNETKALHDKDVQAGRVLVWHRRFTTMAELININTYHESCMGE